MKISVLGCGWLGLPLAGSLCESGYEVKGSTTTEEKIPLLKGKRIQPFLIRLNPALQCNNCGEFWQSDVLVLNIPPDRNRREPGKFHLQQISSVIEQVEKSTISRLVFASSVSVYPKTAGIVDENDARAGKAGRATGNVLLKAEKMLMEADEFRTTVIRFGGLYGDDRHPVHYLSGRKQLDRANAPVNLIHCDDCVAVIKTVIEKNVPAGIFNAVSDGHPPREMYYRAAADALGMEKPVFRKEKENREDHKVVSNRKLKQELGYRFKYPNPMNFNSIGKVT